MLLYPPKTSIPFFLTNACISLQSIWNKGMSSSSLSTLFSTCTIFSSCSFKALNCNSINSIGVSFLTSFSFFSQLIKYCLAAFPFSVLCIIDISFAISIEIAWSITVVTGFFKLLVALFWATIIKSISSSNPYSTILGNQSLYLVPISKNSCNSLPLTNCLPSLSIILINSITHHSFSN